MLRWSLPETTVKFDVYSVVTGSVTPASCCCFSLLHPTGLEDGEPQSSGPSKLVPTAVTHYVLVTFHFRHTGLGPVTREFLLFPWCSSQNPRRTHTLAGTYTRAHAHTQGTMPCCGCCCWPWRPGGKFFATVPNEKKSK